MFDPQLGRRFPLYEVKVCFASGSGSTVCFATEAFPLDSRDVEFWFHYVSNEPNNSFWCPSIAGVAFNDNGAGGGTANNGVPDGGEARQSGVPVRLFMDEGDGTADTATDTLVATTPTDGNGAFTFVAAVGNDYFLDYVDDNIQSAVFTLDNPYDGTITDAGGNPEQPHYDTADNAWVEPDDDPVDGPGGN